MVQSDNLSSLLGLRNGDVVAIIGAGGKHTLMYRLGRELVAAGHTAVLTSTTNLHRNADSASLSIILANGHDDWPQQICTVLAAQRSTVLVDSLLSPNMYRGLEPQAMFAITRAAPEAVVLVKADGARKRLLKAPATNEPVYPPHVDICVLVLSLGAIGKTLDSRHVHRLERVEALTRGHVITPQTLVDVIQQPGGYGQRLPPTARHVLYLSNCSTSAAVRRSATVSKILRKHFHLRVSGDTMRGAFFSHD